MPILLALASVLAIAGLAFAASRTIPALRPARAPWFCPVCIGVSATWLWALVGVHAGWLTGFRWGTVAALLIGGSAAGIAERVSKTMPEQRRMPAKLALLVVGFAVAYVAVRSWYGVVIATIALAAVISRLARAPRRAEPASDLERKLEQCC